MRNIVLMGIGHTNAYVVREWISSSIPDCRLLCISDFPNATYSGMLPGALAGQFTQREMQIDLTALCQRAGAELILAQVTGLDADARTLYFSDREPLKFDLLSIGVGSMPAGWRSVRSPAVVTIKPMSTFLQRLDERLAWSARRHPQTQVDSLRIAIVGGGVASIEIALCLRTRLESANSPSSAIRIFTSSDQVASELKPRSVRRLERILQQRDIYVTTDAEITAVDHETLTDRRGRSFQADCIIWATGAAAPTVLGKLGLPTDDRGFLATAPTLKTLGGHPIFAVGDTGTILQSPSPKAGVYAVRQAPVLWHNLRATLFGRSELRSFQPQHDFLKLLNTGDGKALMQYKFLTIHSRWCWWLKTHIDKSFIKRYQSP